MCAVAIVVSCSDPGPEAPEPIPPTPPDDWQTVTPTLAVTTPALQIGASDQAVFRRITVEKRNTTDAWEIASSPEWITTGDVSETGFTIEIEPYIDGETETREGTIVIEMGELTAEVALTQLVFMIPYVFTVSTEEIPSALAGLTYEIEVVASHAWEVDTDAAWITVSDVTEGGFNISVAEYGDAPGPNRSGTVVVSSRDSECEITLTQIKPNPDAIPLADYLGEYTLTAEEGNNSVTGVLDQITPYQRTVTMTISDLAPNWVSINVFGRLLYLTYDPVTGTMTNNNYAENVWTCSFAHRYLYQHSEWSLPTNMFFALEEGSMTFRLDENGVIDIQKTVDIPPTTVYNNGNYIEIGGDDKDVCLCYFSLTSRMNQSNYLKNMVLTKKP